MMKTVILGNLPFIEKLREDFFIDALTAGGVEVEYWDLTLVFFPDLDTALAIEAPFVRKFRNLNEVRSLLTSQSLSDTLFIAQITYEARSLGLFRLLKSLGCKTGFFARGNLPRPPSGMSISKGGLARPKPIEKMRKAGLKLVRRLPNRFALACKLVGIAKTHDLVFRAGRTGMQTIGVGARLEKSRARIVDINYCDFDKFIAVRNEAARLVEGDYCVWLDEYLPEHPDFAMLGIPTVNAKEYYLSMNRFFWAVEEKFRTRIVIAAHPKADYRENPFEGRQLFMRKTCELVKYCRFGIAHSSTSISFAVLFRKPLLFVYNDEMKRIYADTYCLYVKSFADVLGAACHNMDTDPIAEIDLNPIDETKWDDYKSDFLASKDSDHRRSVEIVVETLKNLRFG